MTYWKDDARAHIFRLLENGSLTPGEALALVCLADYADFRTGDNAYPTVATLSRRCAISNRTVERGLSKGRLLGVIELVRRGGGSGSSARGSTYRFIVDLPIAPMTSPSAAMRAGQPKETEIPADLTEALPPQDEVLVPQVEVLPSQDPAPRASRFGAKRGKQPAPRPNAYLKQLRWRNKKSRVQFVLDDELTRSSNDWTTPGDPVDNA